VTLVPQSDTYYMIKRYQHC